MNNWRLLLLAVVAVLQPIGSFTERYLIDGHQECCDHGTETRDTNLYGTFRKNVQEQRLSSRLTDRPDTRENRRYETRDGNELRRSVERGTVERRFFTERKRSSRHHEGRQREFSEPINQEQSRIVGVSSIDNSRYERTTFQPTRRASLDASRLSQTERTARGLSRDNQDTGSERRMRETERREARQTENRRSNTDRDTLRENRFSNSKERNNQQTRMDSKQNLRDIELSASRMPLNERNNERMEQNSLTRGIERPNREANSDQRSDNRYSEKISRQRLANMRDRQFSVHREHRERNSDDRIVSTLREFREERQEPKRAINFARSIRSRQSRDDNRINERADHRRHETNRKSDDRVESRLRESRDQRLEPQRAISRTRNIISEQSRDDNRINERVEQRQRETNRMSDDRIMSRLRESRQQRLEPQRAVSLSRNIRSIQSRDKNRINERVEQRQRESDDRVVLRLRESREQRLEPQRAIGLSRNVRSEQSHDGNKMNERVEQRRRETNRMSADRIVPRLRESREQRLEPRSAISLSRNIRSVQSLDDNRMNERVEQSQRETNMMSDRRVVSRLRESRQNPEDRLESQRTIRQSRDIRTEQSQYEDRVNERNEQRRQRGKTRMSEERVSRLRETRQSPEQRLDRRTLSLSRIDEFRTRQVPTRSQNNGIGERSEAREKNIMESRNRMVSEREISRVSRSSERSDERLEITARRYSAERRQEAHRVLRIIPTRDATERNEGERNRDFRSSQRQVIRDRRTVDERAISRLQKEVNRKSVSPEMGRNTVEQRSRNTIPSTLRDVRNERALRYRAVSNRDREVRRELKFERREPAEIRLKSTAMVMERIDRAEKSRNRIQNADNSRFRETLIHEKSDMLSFDMNWQYLFYTLQGAYLCGLLIQMLTEKSIKPKTSNFSWWNPVSNNLIKVD